MGLLVVRYCCGRRCIGAEKGLELRHLGRGVESERLVVGDEDADPGPVLEGPELFEVLGLLEQARGPVHELLEEIPAVAVDPHVPVEGQLRRGRAEVGDRTAGEVEGVPVPVEHGKVDRFRLTSSGEGAAKISQLSSGLLTMYCVAFSVAARKRAILSLSIVSGLAT